MEPQNSLNERHKDCVTRMFKSFLKLTEDMKADHDYHYTKLYENIPEQYHPVINAANHFDARKAEWIRKRVLDLGNEGLREFRTEMENYTVSFIFK